jgi:outer membrane protein OmpA-like peptidoglycan-associated protein/tetratricopeptide (TPR) repeat protein|tara:strand:- start:9667 stop:11613 length:1947 start_codon:yes stop_codon:yes gene_type:complete
MKATPKKFIILGFVLLLANISFAQNSKIAKANNQFDKYDYINAREIYLKVVENGFTSAEIYKKLGDTYYYNSDYINSVDWYNKLLAEYPGEIETEYYYRIAQSLKSVEDYKKSKEMMDTYLSLGGVEREVKEFENDPEYLKSLGVHPFKYVINKVAVNSRFSDFGPSYYKDKIVFASSTKDRENFRTHNWNNLPYLDLFVADVDSVGGLSNATPLKSNINTEYHESSSTFTKDGKTMYFTRNNYNEGKKGYDKERTIRLKLYKATYNNDDNSWGNVKELPFNSPEYSVAHPTLSKDEKKLYFASDMEGTFGRSDLWYVDVTKGSDGSFLYGIPINLGPEINTKSRETFPFISENNNLYFSSDGHGGFGGLDVFVSAIDKDGNLQQISNFGSPINTNMDDFGFITKESEGTGYYTSNIDGGRGSIDDEIYYFYEKCVMTINGIVTDIDTEELLPGSEVSILDEDNKLIQKMTVGEDAAFSFTAECDTKYILRGTKNRYFPKEESLETPDEGGVIDLNLQLKLEEPCPPNDLGCRLKLQPIYFDYDKDFIRPDASVELAKILYAMQLYPQLVIHIESHTDSRGRDSYNEKLSERRAQSTLNWLVERGIDKDRLSAKGYGEKHLINECSNDVDCTEEEHQLNRRSMFIIQN